MEKGEIRVDWLIPVLLGATVEDYRRLALVIVRVLAFFATAFRGVWLRWKNSRTTSQPQSNEIYIYLTTTATVIVVIVQHTPGRW
jgi:hypothetical protein